MHCEVPCTGNRLIASTGGNAICCSGVMFQEYNYSLYVMLQIKKNTPSLLLLSFRFAVKILVQILLIFLKESTSIFFYMVSC